MNWADFTIPEDFIIAKDDEFTVVQDSSGFVHILDGENVVRVTMNRSSWNSLVSQTKV
jgi:hypothetical protein